MHVKCGHDLQLVALNWEWYLHYINHMARTNTLQENRILLFIMSICLLCKSLVSFPGKGKITLLGPWKTSVMIRSGTFRPKLRPGTKHKKNLGHFLCPYKKHIGAVHKLCNVEGGLAKRYGCIFKIRGGGVKNHGHFSSHTQVKTWEFYQLCGSIPPPRVINACMLHACSGRQRTFGDQKVGK